MLQSRIRGLAARALASLCVLAILSAPAHASDKDDPPAWAADAIWYQIFPERFRNGDPRNDPTPRDIVGSWPHDPIGEWRVSPWTSDWYELQPWERKNGRDVWFNLQRRRYGGDLQGVIDKLDYLKSLGVNAIYLNPVFEAPSLHKYDATMYHHVDNNFGPDPEGDRALWATEDPSDPKTWKWSAADRLFLRLVREAHRRQMKVIIDGVFNHVGITFWAFRDVREKGRASKYWEWFTIQEPDDPATPENEMKYQAWSNVSELPELRDEDGNLAEGPRKHIRAILARWMDPNGDGDPADGVDGWRLDVAEHVGHEFWEDFRDWVRELNPNAYLTGELFWDDWKNNKILNPAPWLRGDQFDAVMHYRWAVPSRAFFLGRSSAIGAAELARQLEDIYDDYRPKTRLALMSLLDSPDTDRVASQAVNPDFLFDHRVSVREDPSYKVRAPNAAEWRRIRLFATFQFTYQGAPMIYYGTEAGMWGGDDPDERKPMVWPELRYKTERTMPDQSRRAPDPVRFDRSLFAHYQKLARMRAASPALRRGSVEHIDAGDDRVFAFVRDYESQRVVAAFNASDAPKVVTLPVRGPRAIDLLTRKPHRASGEKVRIRLAPWSAVVLQ